MKRQKMTHREKMEKRRWQRMLPDEIAELNKMMEGWVGANTDNEKWEEEPVCVHGD